MFEAFLIQNVIDGLGRKIEALAIWEAQLLVSLSDGGLLVLKSQSIKDVKAPFPWQVGHHQYPLSCICILSHTILALWHMHVCFFL